MAIECVLMAYNLFKFNRLSNRVIVDAACERAREGVREREAAIGRDSGIRFQINTVR